MREAHDAAYWHQVETMFSAIVELHGASRSAALSRLTGDQDVRRDVAALLAAHERAADWLPDIDRRDAGAWRSIGPGDCVGPFTLGELIGSGGMGRVFGAVRTDERFKQQVAIKFVNATMANPEAARRFHAERQILADLQHPNIVTLLDAGVTTDGQAYLVMEYVDGLPASAYCRERALSLRARLELVRQVCAALQHSHRHLVVHRDLKPANILVTPEGNAKVLDFGIAKIVEAGGGDGAAAGLTRADGRVLTTNYASPEQLRGLPATPSSDVYSLGIVMYELLAGTRPYETSQLPLDETLRLVVEREPPPPSAAARVELPYAAAALRGDLDAIVLRALRKEPSERYDSAAALADDIGRYLSGQPVDARDPSLMYVGRKLVARHRAAFVTAGLSFVLVIALLVVSLWAARTARQERDRARAEATKARTIAAFLSRAFTDANPVQARGRTITARELLDRGAAAIATLDGQPDVQSSLLLTMADAYNRLSQFPKALEMAERALALRQRLSAADSVPLGEALQAVGTFRRRTGRPADALPVLNRALAMRERVLGPEHPAVAETLRDLALASLAAGAAPAARALLTRAVGILERTSPHGAQLGLLYNNLASIDVGDGDIEHAERMYTRSIDVYGQSDEAESWGLAMPLLNLASILRDREAPGDLARSQALLTRAMTIDERVFGPESANVAYTLAAMGDLAMARGDRPQAHRDLDASLRLYARTLTPDDVQLVAPNRSLGQLYLEEGHPRAALPFLERALRVSERNHPPGHAEVADVLVDVARARLAADGPARAAPLVRRALAMQRALPADHASLVATLTVAGEIERRQGRIDEARRDLERAVRIARRRLVESNRRRRRAEAALRDLR